MPEGPEVETEKLHETIHEELEHEGGCGCGSWGGRCLSMGDYVTRRGPADEATAAGGG